LIIWGSRGVTSTLKSGQFHCPKCQGKRLYEHKRVRRFFTLYFIPLFPIKDLGEFVECQTCDQTYKEEVLDYDPEAEKRQTTAAIQHALRRVMAAMLVLEETPSEASRAVAMRTWQELSGRALTPGELDEQVRAATGDKRPLSAILGAAAPKLNDAGRELLVKAAAEVALADGPLAPRENEVLNEVARALSVSAAHLAGIVSLAGPRH
jgi:uncharacterized tellurite resistance protein B-like protein